MRQLEASFGFYHFVSLSWLFLGFGSARRRSSWEELHGTFGVAKLKYGQEIADETAAPGEGAIP